MAANDPQFTQQQIYEHAATLRQFEQALADSDPFDRERFEEEPAEYLLDTWVSFPPEFRADMYSGWKMTVDEVGIDELQDFELILMSFQTRDSKARDAVAEGNATFGIDWYNENVMFEGAERTGAVFSPDPNVAAPPKRGTWADTLPLEDRARVESLVVQGLAIYEPTPSQSVSDKLQIFAGRGTLVLGAALAAYMGVGAIAASPTASAVMSAGGALLGKGARGTVKAVGDSARMVASPFTAMSQALYERDIAADKIVNPTFPQKARELFTMIGMRTGKPINDLVVGAAERVSGNSTLLPRVADAMTSGWRGKYLLGSLVSLGIGVGVGAFDPKGLQAAQDELGAENEAKTEEQDQANAEAAGTPPRSSQLVGAWSFDYDALQNLADKVETEVDNTTEAVDVARVRTEQATQLASFARTVAATDELLESRSAGETDGGEDGSLPAPTSIMDSFPELTIDDMRDVTLGLKTMADIPGFEDPEKAITALAMATFPGARFLEPGEDEAALQVDKNLIHDDTSSYASGEVRKIVIPVIPGADPVQMAQYFDESRERIVEQLQAPSKDPFIGDLPDNYRARQYRPLGFGTDVGLEEQEAAFIARVQPGAMPYEEIAPRAPLYRESHVYDAIAGLTAVQVFQMQSLARNALMYQDDRPTLPGQISPQDRNIISQAMDVANKSTKAGQTWWGVLEDMADQGEKWRREDKRAAERNRTVRTREPFSVPASLRSIPGEKTIAEEAKLRFERKLGRQATPEELRGIANELTGYHETSNQEQIALYLAAYNGDNQGLLTGAQMQRIEDPGAATSFDIADKWKDEIDLNKRRETNSESFSRMLSATMGNRPSVGNMTAAANVTQIGRQ